MATPLETIPEETQTPATSGPTPEPTPVRVTAEVPKTKPAKEKNPGRVESGKRLAERNHLAREAKKKAASDTPSGASSGATGGVTGDATGDATGGGNDNSIYLILGVGGLLVSLAGVYYQREAIRERLGRKPAPPAPEPAAPPPSQILVKRQGIRKME